MRLRTPQDLSLDRTHGEMYARPWLAGNGEPHQVQTLSALIRHLSNHEQDRRGVLSRSVPLY